MPLATGSQSTGGAQGMGSYYQAAAMCCTCRRRIRDVCARSGQQGANLFSGEINPSDICQGQLGECAFCHGII